MIAFYLDEHLPRRAAARGRALALDIATVTDRNARGRTDPEQLRIAAAENRVLVSRNYGDFDALAREWETAGEAHAGIVLVPNSIRQEDAESLVTGLALLAELYPDGLPPNTLMWLPNRRAALQ